MYMSVIVSVGSHFCYSILFACGLGMRLIDSVMYMPPAPFWNLPFKTGLQHTDGCTANGQ